MLPKRIVIEDLNVHGMMKNRHLAKAISQQNFYKFRSQLEYKCKERGIELKVANRWFASSKTCSNCGRVKQDLKLSDRVYKCSCGLVLDRDENAARNLEKVV
jgi:putative transposase